MVRLSSRVGSLITDALLTAANMQVVIEFIIALYGLRSIWFRGSERGGGGEAIY